MKLKMCAVAVCGVLAVSACSSPDEKTGGNPIKETFEGKLRGPRKGVFLRASFDDDPSQFMGRFVSENVTEDNIDENRGVKTQCSQFVTYKEVKASGSFDEYYQTSTDVKAGLGVDPMSVPGLDGKAPKVDASVGNTSGTDIRIKYVLTRKLVSDISDPAAFEACCARSPDNCASRYIGEFWAGSGTLYQKAGRSTDVGVDTKAPKVKAGVEVADGWAWSRNIDFEDVFFALRVQDRVVADSCAWATKLPVSDQGQYFVGISPPSATEDIARGLAMRNAREQAVQYLGEYITSRSTSTTNVVKGYVADERVVQSAAEGIASLVKDDRYCAPETVNTPDGAMFKVKVLAYFPNAQRDQAAVQTVSTIKDRLKADGKLTPDAEKEIKAVEADLAKPAPASPEVKP